MSATSRTSNGLLIAGLLLAPFSFLIYLGNAMAMEAQGHQVEKLAIVAMIACNILVAAGLGLAGSRFAGSPLSSLREG